MSERFGRACLVVAAAAAVTAAASFGAAAATRIDCPAQVVYRFQFSDARLGEGTTPRWEVKIHRGEGERSVGLPQLYTRNNELICEYQLPNGAFALSVPYFACE